MFYCYFFVCIPNQVFFKKIIHIVYNKCAYISFHRTGLNGRYFRHSLRSKWIPLLDQLFMSIIFVLFVHHCPQHSLFQDPPSCFHSSNSARSRTVMRWKGFANYIDSLFSYTPLALFKKEFTSWLSLRRFDFNYCA